MTTMEEQCLATLQTLLASCGTATIDPPHLERFYKHYARQPADSLQRLAPCPFKTLLYHYRFLRPEQQASLADFVAAHWPTFTAEAVLPDTAVDSPPTDLGPGIPVPEPSPIVHRFASQAKRDDWFDRFLDVVRILLFR